MTTQTPYRSAAPPPPPKAWRVTSWNKRGVRFARRYGTYRFTLSQFLGACTLFATLGSAFVLAAYLNREDIAASAATATAMLGVLCLPEKTPYRSSADRKRTTRYLGNRFNHNISP